MTAAQTPTIPAQFDEASQSSGFRGCMLIPLAEPGQVLDSPDLGAWLERLAEPNREAVGDFEITARGDLNMMPPPGIPGEWIEAELVMGAGAWSHDHGSRAGGPEARFVMPGGSRLGPDAYRISQERWSAPPDEARTPPFAAVVPDSMAEIVSPSNRETELADRVRRCLESRARLVRVVNPAARAVAAYRPGVEPEARNYPEQLDGGDVMPGFVFNIGERIFDYEQQDLHSVFWFSITRE